MSGFAQGLKLHSSIALNAALKRRSSTVIRGFDEMEK